MCVWNDTKTVKDFRRDDIYYLNAVRGKND